MRIKLYLSPVFQFIDTFSSVQQFCVYPTRWKYSVAMYLY